MTEGRIRVLRVRLTPAEAAWVEAHCTPGVKPTWEHPAAPSCSGLLRQLVRIAMSDAGLEERLAAALAGPAHHADALGRRFCGASQGPVVVDSWQGVRCRACWSARRAIMGPGRTDP